MADYVKLRTGEGQHYDSALEFHVRGKERKALPDIVPAGSLTAQRLAIGGLIRCDPPEEVQQEACQEPNGPVDAEESVQEEPAPIMEPVGASGQGDGQKADEGADKTAGEQTAPAPTSKKRAKTKRATK